MELAKNFSVKNADVGVSLHVDFIANQTRCRELNVPVTNSASNVLGLGLIGLDALQEFGEARAQVAALEASGAEQLEKIDALKIHERELLDENRHLEHQLIVVNLEKKRHGALDVESKKTVTDARLNVQMRKTVYNCPKVGHVHISRQCVPPSGVVTVKKANLGQP